MQQTVEQYERIMPGRGLSDFKVVYEDPNPILPHTYRGISGLYQRYFLEKDPNKPFYTPKDIKVRSDLLLGRIIAGSYSHQPIEELGGIEVPELNSRYASLKFTGAVFTLDISFEELVDELKVRRFQSHFLERENNGVIQVFDYGVIRPANVLHELYRPANSPSRPF